MIKMIALDIGGIVFRTTWRTEGIVEVSKTLEISPDKFRAALEIGKVEFYTGKISEETYWAKVEKSIATPIKIDLAEEYRKKVKINKSTLPLLQKLSKKYRFISCNNCPKEWMDYRIDKARLNEIFSDYITSGYTGVMKPEEEMYKILLNKYSVHELLYIDDNEQYVKKASELGISSTVYDKNCLLNLL